MAINCCHQFLAYNLKLLNFFQFFFGISTVIYSVFLLNLWYNQPPIAPSPPPSPPSLPPIFPPSLPPLSPPYLPPLLPPLSPPHSPPSLPPQPSPTPLPPHLPPSLPPHSPPSLSPHSSPSMSPPSPPFLPPPSPTTPCPTYLSALYTQNRLLKMGGQMEPLNLPGLVLGSDPDSGLIAQLKSLRLPAPWFMYFLMVVGSLLCCMSCIGHIAAEAINGCCLCFYFLLELVLVALEGALVAFIAIDQQWEKDLPFDQTGELEKLKSFFEKYADICKWLGISLLALQALSLLLSLVLRAMVSTRRLDSDVENDYAAAEHRVREPLLSSLSNQAAESPKSEGRGTFSNILTSRIRQKYGLKNESSTQLSNESSSTRV